MGRDLQLRTRLATTLLVGAVAATAGSVATAQKPRWSRAVIGGRVLDVAGRPVPGATVRLIEPAYPGLPWDLHTAFALQPRTYRESTTDNRGRFRFTVRHGDRASLQARKAKGDGAGHLMSLVSDPVSSGAFVTITAWPTRVVHGVCRDRATNRPLADNPVHVVVPIGNGSDPDETWALQLSTRTDAKGRYRVRVPLGTWVKVRTPGCGCLCAGVVHENVENDFLVGVGTPMLAGILLDEGRRALENVMVVDAADSRIRCLTDARGSFRLQPMVASQGPRWVHVFASGYPPRALAVAPGDGRQPCILTVPAGNRIRVRLVDKSGRPIGNRSVVLGGYATPPDLRGHRITSHELHTDANGVFHADIPEDCRYLSAFVEHEGCYVWFFSGAPKAGGDVGNLTIAPLAGVRGRVTCGTRLPAARERILLMRLPDDGSSPNVIVRTHKRLPALARWTDSGGRFAFPPLQPGTYEVAFVAEHHGPVVRRFRVPLGKDDGQLIRSGQLWFQLPAHRPIRGVVVDGEGAPIQGALVSGQPLGRRVSGLLPALCRFGLNPQGCIKTRTDEKGRFTLFANDGDTSVVVNALLPQKPRWRSTNVARVDPSNPAELRLVMR